MGKSILIFFPHRLKKNFGGPYTYLYQLKSAFTGVDVNLVFLSDLISFENDEPKSPPATSFFKRMIKKFIPGKIIYSIRIERYLKEIQRVHFLPELQKIEYASFDAIHFHETVDIWRFHHLLQNFEGKIILTSHSPKPYHLELLEDVFNLDKSKIWRSTYKKLEAIDVKAFEKADSILAPCKEAFDAYQQHWPSFNGLTKNKSFQFIPTGIGEATISKSLAEVRKELAIPQDAFVVCFNGRHNKVKGYDLLIETALDLLEKYQDIYFIITGKKGGNDLIKNQRWIETGWTTEPESFMNASDIIVVPNRETYFDLNVLMALSLGKSLILSETGGNEYFKQFTSASILFFNVQKVKALTHTIEYAYENREALRATGEKNRELYQHHFTVDHFASQYNQFYLSL